MATRSSRPNIGLLPAFIATPSTSLSTSFTARPMMSIWPLWIGSNVPGYRPTRVMRLGPPTVRPRLSPGTAVLAREIAAEAAIRRSGLAARYPGQDHGDPALVG